ncbi:MAG: PQQ-dependent sugar dehydrogenase [Pseudomonadota bacterium]
MSRSEFTNRIRHIFATLLLLCAGSATSLSFAADQTYDIETVASGLDFPWSIAFLPNGDYLVAELVGNVRRISADGTVHPPIEGVPPVFRMSQGGLFDVLLAPDFASTGILYLSYAAGPPENNATTIARARLVDNRLENVEEIFAASPRKPTPVHYGGRMLWLQDGTLLLATGDGFDYREEAQNIGSHFGKTLRMNPDGSPANGNPFPQNPYVWTYGHRNPQGLIISSKGTVYLHEHGPQGGDEINIIEQGKNYGWPAITYGLDYNGAYVSPLTEYPGMAQPEHVWTPSIAPSGFMIYEGDQFPDWKGDLFIGALVDQEVRHINLDGGALGEESVVFAEITDRVRDIRQSPSGDIFVLTDGNQGEVFRIRATHDSSTTTQAEASNAR